MQMAVRLRVGAVHMKLGRGDAFALCLLRAECGSGAERGERFTQGRKVGAGIEQRADGHISRDAGKRVNIGDLHSSNRGSNSPAGPRSE
jgi:hypothetical protein